jgi:hypothetical protein
VRIPEMNSLIHGKDACGRVFSQNLLRLSNATISSADSIGSARQFVLFFNGKDLGCGSGWPSRPIGFGDLMANELRFRVWVLAFGQPGEVLIASRPL